MKTTPLTPHLDQRLAAADWRQAAPLGSAEAASIIETPCAPCPVAEPSSVCLPRAGRHTSRGFTLIESMLALGVAGLLSSVALPSFEAQLQKARRADVLVSMMQVQMAEERWRSNSASYGTLAQIGAAATSASGHYALAISAPQQDGYTIDATATGAQARDAACRHMRLTITGMNITRASGPDASVSNSTAANRKCWNL